MNEIRVSEAAYRKARANIARTFVRLAVRNRGDDFTSGQLSGLHAAFLAVPGSTEDEFVAMCSEPAFGAEIRTVLGGVTA